MMKRTPIRSDPDPDVAVVYHSYEGVAPPENICIALGGTAPDAKQLIKDVLKLSSLGYARSGEASIESLSIHNKAMPLFRWLAKRAGQNYLIAQLTHFGDRGTVSKYLRRFCSQGLVHKKEGEGYCISAKGLQFFQSLRRPNSSQANSPRFPHEFPMNSPHAAD